jgi:hypothetical protein
VSFDTVADENCTSAETGSDALELAVAQATLLAEIIDSLPDAEPGSKEHINRQVENFRNSWLVKIQEKFQDEASRAKVELGESLEVDLDINRDSIPWKIYDLATMLVEETLRAKGYQASFDVYDFYKLYVSVRYLPKTNKGWIRSFFAALLKRS